MKRILGTALLLACVAAMPAHASLAVGAKAPNFALKAAKAGNEFNFSLAAELKKGPVVLYFFPAAFTPGCTVEAHEFAEATDKFAALGATVIGVTSGNPERVREFSSVECRNKFAVAADADQRVVKAYDAVLTKAPQYSDRTSYVISPNGRILMVYTDLNPDKHVDMAMDAVKKWKAAH